MHLANVKFLTPLNIRTNFYGEIFLAKLIAECIIEKVHLDDLTVYLDTLDV